MTATTKHTPGPWEVSPKDPCRVNVAMNTFLHPYEPRVATGDEMDDDDFHDDWNICQANDDHYSRPDDECIANARLISAAPELLAACRLMAATLQGFTAAELVKRAGEIHPASFDDAQEAIWAAIRKATENTAGS